MVKIISSGIFYLLTTNFILMCNVKYIYKQMFRMISSIHLQCKSEMKHADTEMKL